MSTFRRHRAGGRACGRTSGQASGRPAGRAGGRPGGRAVGRSSGRSAGRTSPASTEPLNGARMVVCTHLRLGKKTGCPRDRGARRLQCSLLACDPGWNRKWDPKTGTKTGPGFVVRKVEYPRWVFNLSYLDSGVVFGPYFWNHPGIENVFFF